MSKKEEIPQTNPEELKDHRLKAGLKFGHFKEELPRGNKKYKLPENDKKEKRGSQ